MAYGGPAFGLRSNDRDGEGFGLGRCVAVLAGGPAGGHQAAVLCAAFHPSLPLIATSGMDHAVKIWQMPHVKSEDPDKSLMIRREDKPLFSSTRVHMAQVLSISWIGADTLLSHSGPVSMRRKLGDRDGTTHLYPMKFWRESGTMVLWRWLGLDRYFPPGAEIPDRLRGCASDYQESSSFKIISAYLLPLPKEPVRVHVFSSPSHAPLIVLPGKVIWMSSMKHFKPRKRPPFPEFEEEIAVPAFDVDDSDSEIEELTDATGRMTTNEVDNVAEGETESEIERTAVPKLDSLPVWKMQHVDVSSGNINAGVKACILGENGRLLLCVGEKEGVWIWRIPPGHE